MKNAIANLFTLPKRKETAFEVQEELQFHIEMLERKYAQQGMSAARAKAAALQRFGNVERVKKQCVDISRRNSPLRRVLKILSIVIAITGLVIQTLSSDYKVARIGGMLIMIAFFGRLLLYVRGLKPWSFLPGTKRTFLTDSPDDGART
ncbi:MAG TPA: permease prefix domain 1-containing protein [Pyrinomonadaceae bacterium]|nr:permease prefix domain 1-containing protein [Pyrinomonadaceae bacterium]